MIVGNAEQRSYQFSLAVSNPTILRLPHVLLMYSATCPGSQGL